MVSEAINYGAIANISYLAELIPLHSCRMQEGGINSQTLVTVKRGSYNLRRSFGASVNYLLIK